jgi:hypothetical protein
MELELYVACFYNLLKMTLGSFKKFRIKDLDVHNYEIY